MITKDYTVARMPGDGIGPEVIREASKVVEAAAAKYGFSVTWADYPFGAEHWLRTGETLPDSTLDEIGEMDALLLGAVGDPRVKPGVLERGILLKIRFHYDQYANLRPARSYPNVPTPVRLSTGGRLDTLVVRENTEDFYIGIGGRTQGSSLSMDLTTQRGLYSVTGGLEGGFTNGVEGVIQLGVATEPGIRRVTALAARAAKERGESGIALATKSNVMPQIYGFWEEVAKDEAARHGVGLTPVNADAMCYHLARTPELYGVILAPNMFGDIVSDLLAGLAGGLGTAAGADIGDGLSMFEPVHGSAPDIAGTGRANPIAAILTAAMMLDHLGEREAARRVDEALTTYLSQSVPKELPFEFGGEASTATVGDRIAEGV
ncbi:MAG: isocitrate/isopropylmalate family dehydrogenase [Aminobacteriaceae bacterium]